MAQLVPVPFPSPGFFGLNRQRAGVPMTAEWAEEAMNAVVDNAGRIAARKGWVAVTTPETGEPVVRLHEYVALDGSTSILAHTSDGATAKIWESADGGGTWNNRSGALTPAVAPYQFVNFNGKVLGAAAGAGLIVKSTIGGNFSALVAASGSLPTTPTAILSAYGRIWTISDDGQTLSYSALLDETLWAEGDGGGTQDLTMWWTRGTDQAIGLAAFGTTLVVFGKRHIFLVADGQGSDRGLDPSTMFVEDTLENVGTVDKDSIQLMGEGDILFLSQTGVRSLLRVMQDRTTPLNDLSMNNRDFLLNVSGIARFIPDTAVGLASPENGFYLLRTTDGLSSSRMFCIDTRTALPDGSFRMFDWDNLTPTTMIRLTDGSIYFGFSSGKVGAYQGYQDDGESYRFEFRSGYLDLGPETNAIEKALKRLKAHVYAPGPQNVVLTWGWDFDEHLNGAVVELENAGNAQYGSLGPSWTEGQYTAPQTRSIQVPTTGSGQFFRIGVSTMIDSYAFGVAQLTAFYTPLRLS